VQTVEGLCEQHTKGDIQFRFGEKNENKNGHATHHSHSISQSQQLPHCLSFLPLFATQRLPDLLSPAFILHDAQLALERSFQFGEGGLKVLEGGSERLGC